MLQALIVDDEAPAREELAYLLSREEGIQVAAQAAGGVEAVELALAHRPDVVFLDIQMRGMSGLETAAVLRRLTPEALILFATAYDEHALKAFELGAVDYLLKPFEGERVHLAVQRLRRQCPQERQEARRRLDEVLRQGPAAVPKLPVCRQGHILLVPFADISYVTVQEGEVQVVAGGLNYVFQGTLAEVEERTRGTRLVRVHKSFLVNLNRVDEVIPWFKGTYWLKVDGQEVPVSKALVKEVKHWLGLR